MTPIPSKHPSNPASPQAVIIGLIIASLFAPIDVTAEDGRQVLALASLSGQVRCRSGTARGCVSVYPLPTTTARRWLTVQANGCFEDLLPTFPDGCRPWR